ncbi:unnamed protein product [Alopecurus aequalis]
MPPPLTPTLPDELLDEIFLRLPPDEPGCLVRASLASKLWLGLLTSPKFSARYRKLHGPPPMLGFCPMDSYPFEEKKKDFCAMDQEDRVKCYFSTTKFGARIPEDKSWGRGKCAYSVQDCRHGRVLLDTRPFDPDCTLLVWDPISGCRREMHLPGNYTSFSAAVLCTVPGCDHRACREGPCMVVSVGMEGSEDEEIDYADFFARTWSSETGEWTDPSYAPALPDFAFAILRSKPPVLIQNTLYFMIWYPVEEQAGFIIYDLESSSLSVLEAPPFPGSVDYDSGYIHMAAQDGNLVFAYVDKFALHLWSRQPAEDPFASVEA